MIGVHCVIPGKKCGHAWSVDWLATTDFFARHLACWTPFPCGTSQASLHWGGGGREGRRRGTGSIDNGKEEQREDRQSWKGLAIRQVRGRRRADEGSTFFLK